MLFRNFYDLNKLLMELDFFNESPLGDKNGDWESKKYVSDDGMFSYSVYKKSFTNKNTSELTTLKSQLESAVENQEFEKAVELRDKIKKLELNKNELEKLNKELSNCVKKQDFEKAIEIRDKIKELK
jgi:excinuclease UvrABC helicase subunit UvrB